MHWHQVPNPTPRSPLEPPAWDDPVSVCSVLPYDKHAVPCLLIKASYRATSSITDHEDGALLIPVTKREPEEYFAPDNCMKYTYTLKHNLTPEHGSSPCGAKAKILSMWPGKKKSFTLNTISRGTKASTIPGWLPTHLSMVCFPLHWWEAWGRAWDVATVHTSPLPRESLEMQ